VAPCAVAQQIQQQTAVQNAAPRPAGASQTAPERAPWLQTVFTLKEGRLTGKVQDRPLGWVLDQLQLSTPVHILVDDLVGGERVWVEFENVPLDEAFRQVLKNYDTFFQYSKEKDSEASLKAVWVYPAGQGTGLQPVPKEKWASTKELEEDAASKDPEVRIRALTVLIERKGARSRDLVLGVLNDDQDVKVRTRTLYSAIGADVDLPRDMLINMLLSDPSDNIRFLALTALPEGPELEPVIQRALTDQSPHVRSRAQDILGRLKPATSGSVPPHGGGQRPQ